MFLAYLDASGSSEVTDPTSSHYVLTALCMRDGSWFALDKRLNGLKERYQFPGGTPIELHVKQFACLIREQDEVPDFEQLDWDSRRRAVLAVQRSKLAGETNSARLRQLRKKFRNYEAFLHLSRRERSQLLEDAVALIASHNGIRFFAEAIDKRHPAVVSGECQPSVQAFEQVVSRFDTFLQVLQSRSTTRTGRVHVDLGLLILDQDPSTESKIDHLFQHFRSRGHSFGTLRNVIDVPLFASSARVSGLQIADVCAYVVRRYLDSGAIEGSYEDRQFRAVFPKFDRDSGGRLHGIRHYVEQGKCSCLICSERGHGSPTTKPESRG